MREIRLAIVPKGERIDGEPGSGGEKAEVVAAERCVLDQIIHARFADLDEGAPFGTELNVRALVGRSQRLAVLLNEQLRRSPVETFITT